MYPLKFKCVCSADNNEVIITPPESLLEPLEFHSIRLIVNSLSENDVTLVIRGNSKDESELVAEMVKEFEASDPSNEMGYYDLPEEGNSKLVYFQAEFSTKPFELENEELYKIIRDFFASCLSELDASNNFKIKLNDCINKVMKTQGVSFVKFEEKPSMFSTTVPAPAITVATGQLVQLDV